MAKPLIFHPLLKRSELDPKHPKNKKVGDTEKASDTLLLPEEIAHLLGQDIVIPRNDEIFVDLDRPTLEDIDQFYMMLDTLRVNDIHCVLERFTPSRTSGNYHIVVRFPGCVFGPIERIALQCILGSDRKRDLWGYLRHRHNDPTPTLFFEKKAEEGKGWEVVDDEIPF